MGQYTLIQNYNPMGGKFGGLSSESGGSPAVSSSAGASAGAAGAGMIASGVISGIADIVQSNINAKRLKNTYEFNAQMAQLQGRMTRLAADVEIKNIRKKAQTLFSFQRAAYAKAGVKLSGSPAEVMFSSLKESELDALYADISAQYNVGLTRTQSDIYNMYSKSAQADNLQNTLKTILNVGTKYMAYSNFGGK